MSRKRLIPLIYLVCILGGLFLINRDLFRFSFTYPYAREFSAETAEKGYSQIVESLTLKPAVYRVRYKGETDGKMNGFSIRDREGNVYEEGTFDQGKIDRAVSLTVSGSAKQVQFGVIYDGDGSMLRVDQIEITCPHVLYRDSLVRHAVLSLAFVLLVILLRPSRLKNETTRMLLFFALISLFSCYPLLTPGGYVLADDMQYHLARIEGIASSWKAGIFPARIHLFVLQNYGYGNGFFYPQLWLFIPAVLRLLGFPVMDCYNIFVVLCTFLAMLSVYSCTRHISGSRTGAMAAAVLFCLVPYRLIDIYYRGALGEIQSFIFIPFIITAFYDRLCLRRDSWELLALGFFGLLGSHIISFTIVCIITALFAAVSLIFAKERIRFLFFLFKGALLTTLLGSWFLLPMAEQWKKTRIVVNILLSNAPGGIMESRWLPPQYLFRYFEPWTSKTPWPGLCLWGVILCALICLLKRIKTVRPAYVLCLVSLLCFWISTSLFPWELRTFSWLFTRIQFTWRFLMIPAVCLPVAGGIIFPVIFEKVSPRIRLITVLFCALLCAEPLLYEAVEHRFVKTPQFILQQNRVGGAEYMPRGIDLEFVDKNRDTVLFNGEPVSITDHDRKGLGFTFTYDLPAITREDVFDVPLAFYTGYRGRLTGSDGKVVPLEVFQGSRGLAAVSGISENSGTIEVRYQKTGLQKAGEVISLLTLCAWFVIRKKRPGSIHPQQAQRSQEQNG